MDEELKIATAIVDSSGNVFADLDLPTDEKSMLKVFIATAINETVNRRKLTQSKAAAMVGLDQPKMSAILRGRLDTFSVDRLISCLLRLGR